MKIIAKIYRPNSIEIDEKGLAKFLKPDPEFDEVEGIFLGFVPVKHEYNNNPVMTSQGMIYMGRYSGSNGEINETTIYVMIGLSNGSIVKAPYDLCTTIKEEA